MGGGGNLSSPQKLLNHIKSGVPFAAPKMGFTLAEVLITLGIIGIVAAMTLPAVINKIQKKDTSARLKKFYSAFNQAIRRSTVDNGPVWSWNDQVLYHDADDLYDWFEKYIAQYMVIVQNCRDGKSKCTGNYQYCNPATGSCSNSNNIAKSSILYVFADGGSITALTGGNLNPDSGIVTGLSVEMAYDTNGYKKPNIQGKDIFYFALQVKDDDKYNFLQCTGCINGCKNNNYVTLNDPREELLNACKIEPSTCGCLLMSDGWEFKKDYPW